MPDKRPPADTTKWALTASDIEVGPACSFVPVPPTVVMDAGFREVYTQGYRHALSDARAVVARILAERERTS
jgi:hypothetical protein